MTDGETLTMDCPLGNETYTCDSSGGRPDGRYWLDYVCTGIVPACVYWSETEQEWSGMGCEVVNYTATNVTCGCTHLTDFAVATNKTTPSTTISYTQMPTAAPTPTPSPAPTPGPTSPPTMRPSARFVADATPSPTTVPIPSPTSVPTISHAPTILSASDDDDESAAAMAVGGVILVVGLGALGMKMSGGAKAGSQVAPLG